MNTVATRTGSVLAVYALAATSLLIQINLIFGDPRVGDDASDALMRSSAEVHERVLQGVLLAISAGIVLLTTLLFRSKRLMGWVVMPGVVLSLVVPVSLVAHYILDLINAVHP